MPSHPSAAPLRLTLTASLLLSALGLTACNSDNNTRFDPPAAPTGLGYEATADANSAVTAYIDAGASNQRGKACLWQQRQPQHNPYGHRGQGRS